MDGGLAVSCRLDVWLSFVFMVLGLEVCVVAKSDSQGYWAGLGERRLANGAGGRGGLME